MDSPSWPETFYIFVNQARYTARNNYARTGKFISGAFCAAHSSLVPAGTIMPFTGEDGP